MRNRAPIVRCSGEGHRVRLAGGRRFFAAARCPRCGAPVDPWRWRRVLAGARELLRPSGERAVDRVGHGLAVGWIAVVLVATLLLWGFADVWWPATILLFGPRWVLLVPAAVLVPWALWRDRALVAPLLLALLVGAGPLVGLRSGIRALLPTGDGPTLTVASLNARGGDDLPPLTEMLADWNADVVLFQECSGPLREQILALEGDHSPVDVHAATGLCMVTRLELQQVSQMEREAFRFAGGAGLVWSYRLGWYDESLTVTNLHLETQREGLELVRQGQVAEAIAPLEEKSFLRSIELQAARRWVDGLDGPHIVAGDFNTPPESRIYRSAWSDWTNAFDARGRGLGGTRPNGWIRARIDHVLLDPGWRVVEVRVADDVGSDHLPVVARVRRR
ncbi:endonuclease/exonuclease/phosphatase family protein [Gaopeijia maritima]|uniref:Endonuclease/exonuclease/phosphatase family protein n=1 Tax=Gaopeijia maritima TaxID=3119007 RepID=A0ABU9EGD2_9BACT